MLNHTLGFRVLGLRVSVYIRRVESPRVWGFRMRGGFSPPKYLFRVWGLGSGV